MATRPTTSRVVSGGGVEASAKRVTIDSARWRPDKDNCTEAVQWPGSRLFPYPGMRFPVLPGDACPVSRSARASRCGYPAIRALVALAVGLPLYLRAPLWCDITLYDIAARNLLSGQRALSATSSTQPPRLRLDPHRDPRRARVQHRCPSLRRSRLRRGDRPRHRSHRPARRALHLAAGGPSPPSPCSTPPRLRWSAPARYLDGTARGGGAAPACGDPPRHPPGALSLLLPRGRVAGGCCLDQSPAC